MMQEYIETFSKISTSAFWSKMFIGICNDNYPTGVKITKTKFYYEDDYVDINKCKDVADFYTKVVIMLEKYIDREETWVNTKKNTRTDMIEKYAKRKAKKYELDDEYREKLISTLHMLLFLKNSKTLVTLKNGRIKKISCLKFNKGSFSLGKLTCSSFQVTKKGERDVFSKQCNKFEKNMRRKINTYS